MGDEIIFLKGKRYLMYFSPKLAVETCDLNGFLKKENEP